MICLVSGASGFIGRNLCSALQSQGDIVIAGLRSRIDGPWNRVAVFDLDNNPVSSDDIQGVSCVFHLAGKAHALSETSQDIKEYQRLNTGGTRQLLEASRDASVRRFVYISSVKVMREGGADALDETAECQPVTPYGYSKLEAERLVMSGGYVPEPVVLRLSMVYGPTRKGNLPRMIEAVSKNHFPSLQDVGNKRSMVHVDDVVRIALLAAEKPKAAGKTYIVTDGQVYSTRQIYEWICTAIDKPIPKLTIPISVLRVMAKVGDGIGALRNRRFMFDSDALDKLVGSAVYSSEKINQELNFRPEHDLQSAIPEIVAYLNLR